MIIDLFFTVSFRLIFCNASSKENCDITEIYSRAKLLFYLTSFVTSLFYCLFQLLKTELG